MLGERLRKLRNERNLTQKEIAKILGIPRGTYAHYEINKRTPDFDLLKETADYYNVSLDYLLDRTNVKDYGLSDDSERDIIKRLYKILDILEYENNLLIDGVPASKEAIETLLDAIIFAIEQAKNRNEKYMQQK